MNEQISMVEIQKVSYKDKIDQSKKRIEVITQIRMSQEKRLDDALANNLIARNPVALEELQNQTLESISKTEKDIETENVKIQSYTDEIFNIDKTISNIRLGMTSKKDILTFKFVADEFGVEMNKVVKWFIITLICVFDPLAICLLLAYNTAAFREEKPNVEAGVVNDNIESEAVKITSKEKKIFRKSFDTLFRR